MGRGIEHAENDREENPPDKIIDNGRPQNRLTDAGSQQIQIHQQFVMLQMQQQLAMQAAVLKDESRAAQDQQATEKEKLAQSGARAPNGAKALPSPSPQQGVSREK